MYLDFRCKFLHCKISCKALLEKRNVHFAHAMQDSLLVTMKVTFLSECLFSSVFTVRSE